MKLGIQIPSGVISVARTSSDKSQAILDFLMANPEADNSQVVDALAGQGFPVDSRSVSNQRWRMKKNSGTSPEAAAESSMSDAPEKKVRRKKKKKAGAKKKAGRSKDGVNRSQLIRDYLKANPDAPNRDVVSALSNDGVTVTQGLVSSVKQNLANKASKPGRPGRKPGVKSAPKEAAAADDFSDLVETKKLVKKLGSFKNVRKALEMLEVIMNS